MKFAIAVLSHVVWLAGLVSLIYLPVCAVMLLARSIASLGDDGKMTEGERWIAKLFSWRYLFWAIYVLLISFCIVGADCHPVHDGMTETESKILCWKALLSGPYAGQVLPCVPERISGPLAAGAVIPMLFLLPAAVLAAFRRWRLALYGLAIFTLIWFLMAAGALGYWK